LIAIGLMYSALIGPESIYTLLRIQAPDTASTAVRQTLPNQPVLHPQAGESAMHRSAVVEKFHSNPVTRCSQMLCGLGARVRQRFLRVVRGRKSRVDNLA
jgi:hypothetical protein